MTEVLDLRGEAVQVGDTIAYAATDGRSGGIRVGKVLQIIPEHKKWDSWDKEREYGGRTVPTKLQVDVEFSSGYWKPGKPTLIDSTLRRFVLIEKAPPAPPVPKTREEQAAFATEWDAKVEAGRK